MTLQDDHIYDNVDYSDDDLDGSLVSYYGYPATMLVFSSCVLLLLIKTDVECVICIIHFVLFTMAIYIVLKYFSTLPIEPLWECLDTVIKFPSGIISENSGILSCHEFCRVYMYSDVCPEKYSSTQWVDTCTYRESIQMEILLGLLSSHRVPPSEC